MRLEKTKGKQFRPGPNVRPVMMVVEEQRLFYETNEKQPLHLCLSSVETEKLEMSRAWQIS